MVLDGALSLAVPTVFGQSLTVKPMPEKQLLWESYDVQQQLWFKARFKLQNKTLGLISTSDEKISDRLLQILTKAQLLNSEFLASATGCAIETQLEFPTNWGLGTSSTLISMIANWAEVDPYQLLDETFGGSGYDIACANAPKSLTYQLTTTPAREINLVAFNPSFKDQLYFVHLNQKQNSRDGIAQYRSNSSDKSVAVTEVSNITNAMIRCENLAEFQELMQRHEQLLSKLIQLAPVKARLFADFEGSIKSLGAWGGDFVLVASTLDPSTYFKTKGYATILPYSEMVKY